jgi:hypothetical protein
MRRFQLEDIHPLPALCQPVVDAQAPLNRPAWANAGNPSSGCLTHWHQNGDRVVAVRPIWDNQFQWKSLAGNERMVERLAAFREAIRPDFWTTRAEKNSLRESRIVAFGARLCATSHFKSMAFSQPFEKWTEGRAPFIFFRGIADTELITCSGVHRNSLHAAEPQEVTGAPETGAAQDDVSELSIFERQAFSNGRVLRKRL